MTFTAAVNASEKAEVARSPLPPTQIQPRHIIPIELDRDLHLLLLPKSPTLLRFSTGGYLVQQV